MDRRSVIRMTKRMTWTEIKERYPNQWVGLRDVIRKDTSADIASAVLAYTDKSRTELLRMQIRDGDIVTMHTSPELLDDIATMAGC